MGNFTFFVHFSSKKLLAAFYVYDENINWPQKEVFFAL